MDQSEVSQLKVRDAVTKLSRFNKVTFYIYFFYALSGNWKYVEGRLCSFKKTNDKI